MVKEIRFTVPGYVQPKERTFGRSFVTPPKTRAYELEVRLAGKQAMNGMKPLAGFVGVNMEIVCAIPKSWKGKKRSLAEAGTLKPTHCDIDNQIKAIGDGMNKIVYEDDRLVNGLNVIRRYGPEDKATICVWEL